MDEPINLHTISALQNVKVLDDVKLRPLRQSDATRILEILAADKSIRKRVTIASHLYTEKDIKTEIDKYRKNPGFIRYVLLKEDNPIGLVSLWRDNGFWGSKNLNDYGFGYFLDPIERGKGIMTNALRILMSTVFQNIYVHQFVAFCEDDNHESIAVLEKLGFKQTDKTFADPENSWIERKYIKSYKD